MLIATITNTASFSIGPAPGTDPLVYASVYPPVVNQSIQLPGPFQWATLASGANKTFAVSVSDLNNYESSPGYGLMRVKDWLQQYIQMGLITVTYAAVGATDRETLGKAINVQ